ncbi:four-helix bundle copper-binding protein [Bacillus tianshenii]|nr:four-helix bundle copper-binding protein [Bacillus tianshenii]
MPHGKYHDLIEILHKCMAACNHCYEECLKDKYTEMLAECIRLDRECADMCGYLEQALVRGTPFVTDLAGVCATICEACGNECQKQDYEHCRKCADVCFKCAKECKDLVA